MPLQAAISLLAISPLRRTVDVRGGQRQIDPELVAYTPGLGSSEYAVERHVASRNIVLHQDDGLRRRGPAVLDAI